MLLMLKHLCSIYFRHFKDVSRWITCNIFYLLLVFVPVPHFCHNIAKPIETCSATFKGHFSCSTQKFFFWISIFPIRCWKRKRKLINHETLEIVFRKLAKTYYCNCPNKWWYFSGIPGTLRGLLFGFLLWQI